MQKIFYPGNIGQPFLGQYAVVLDRSGTTSHADIVLVNRHAHCAPSFFNSDFGRDAVVNRILDNDLNGIGLDWIRLFVLVEREPSKVGRMPAFAGVELHIELDIDDYIAKNNPYVRQRNILSWLFRRQETIEIWSGHRVGGCARVSTPFDRRRMLPEDEIHALCTRIGIAPQKTDIPTVRNYLASEPNRLASSALH